MEEQKTAQIQETKEDDKPDYQEKIMFLVSTSAQGAILAWCLIVLSLGYVKLPNRLFGMDIPDQPRVDSTFAAGLLGNILAGWVFLLVLLQELKRRRRKNSKMIVIMVALVDSKL